MDPEAGGAGSANPDPTRRRDRLAEAERREAALRRQLDHALSNVDAAAAELELLSEELSRTRSQLDTMKALGAEEAAGARARIEAMQALDVEQVAKTRARVENIEALRHENGNLRGLVDAYKAKYGRLYEAWQVKCTELAKLKDA